MLLSTKLRSGYSTGAELKTAYENESDTNAYTDSEKTKLGGVETGADVTADAITDDYLLTAGRIGNPLIHLPLKNDDNFITGTGTLTFTNDSTTGNFTYIDRYGVVQDGTQHTPRFEAEGLLIEGSSTNLFVQSDNFDTTWAVSGVTVTSDDATSPDDVASSADRVAITSGGYIVQSPTVTVVVGTISFWIKAVSAGSDDKFKLSMNNGSDQSAEMTAAATWQRVELSATLTIGNSFGLVPSSGDLDVYLWGAQLEELPFASSYIPTTTAAVTRAADVCYLTYTGNYPDETTAADRTVLVDVNMLGDNTSVAQMVFYSYNAGDFISNSTSETLNTRINGDALSGTAFTYGTTQRISLVSDGTNSKLYRDGALVDSATLTLRTAATQVQINIGSYNTTSQYLFGHISNFRIYDVALSAGEMKIA